MNILLFHSDVEKLRVLAFCLESQVEVNLKIASTLEQCMCHFLEEDSIDLIVANECEQLPLLMKYVLSVGSKVPMMLICANAATEFQGFSDIQIMEQIKESDAAKILPAAIKKHYEALVSGPSEVDGYCRINVELLCDVTPFADAVYVRLSNIKFVKLFAPGTMFTQKDLTRLYGVKKIEYLYIKKASAGEFVNRLQDRLNNVSTKTEDGDENLISTVAYVQEALQDLTHKIGFTPEVAGLARQQVELTVKAIGKFPRLQKILDGSLMRGENQTSRHSVMVAQVACAIASKLSWPSDSTFQKLTTAALMHDITLTKPELTRIHSKAELMKAKETLSPEDFSCVEGHPFTASQMVDRLHEIPGDVYLVVLQHHERPDGSGFPKAMRSHAIAPLAAVFIAAHEMVDAHTDLGTAFDMNAFWESRTESYNSGTFKKILKCFTDPEKDKEKKEAA